MVDQDVLVEACPDFPRRLVETSDMNDVVHQLVECTSKVSGIAGVGVSLLESDKLIFTAALNEPATRIEQAQEAARRGPSIDAHRSRELIVVADLTDFAEQWPEVVAAATEVGIRAAAAIPMHLDGEAVGVLDLYDLESREWSNEKLRAAQWLADMATAYLLLISRLHSAETRAAQLQHALDSRVVIEQAKGMLAERLHLDMAQSFATLRNHARNHNLRLADVANSVIESSYRPRLDALAAKPGGVRTRRRRPLRAGDVTNALRIQRASNGNQPHRVQPEGAIGSSGAAYLQLRAP